MSNWFRRSESSSLVKVFPGAGRREQAKGWSRYENLAQIEPSARLAELLRSTLINVKRNETRAINTAVAVTPGVRELTVRSSILDVAAGVAWFRWTNMQGADQKPDIIEPTR